MSGRPDSAQVAAAAGLIGGLSLPDMAATLCALVGTAYTLWKWRRDARKKG